MATRMTNPGTFVDNSSAVPINASFCNNLVTAINTPVGAINKGLFLAPSAAIPEYPDDPAGATYLQGSLPTDLWTGWDSVGSGTLSVSGGVLSSTVSATTAYLRLVMALGTLKTIRIKYKTPIGGDVTIKGTVGGVANSTIKAFTAIANVWNTLDCYVAGDLTAVYTLQGGLSIGHVISASFVYIGTGAYLSKALDASGNGNHATVYGATPVDTVAGKGFSFDGVNDRGTYPTTNKTTLTLSAWVNFTATTADMRIIQENGGSGAYAKNNITITSKKAACAWRTSSASVDGLNGTVDLNNGISHLITFTHSGALATLYVDGLSVASKVATLGSEALDALGLIASNAAPAAFFQGTIADPRIYNRALTAEEVWELWQNPGAHNLDQVPRSATAIAGTIPVFRDNLTLAGTDPADSTTAGTIGYQTAIDVASGSTLTMPSGSGTYRWTIMTYGATINSVKTGTTAAGASATGTASANLTVHVKRIA